MKKNQVTETAQSNVKVVNLVLIPGLIGIVYSLVTNNVVLMGTIVAFPLLVIMAVKILQLPLLLYFAIFVVNYLIMGIARYINISGISVLMDVLMIATLVLIIVHSALLRNIEWKHGVNVLTAGTFIWMLYCLAEVYNPTGVVKGWVLSRGLIVNGFFVSLIVALLFDKYKWVKTLLLMYALFTLLAIIKALMQKRFGFDWAETEWLDKGSYRTHLLRTGTRYFSFFTDAGNFGSNMGCAGIVFFIVACYIKSNKLKLFYGLISILAIYTMFLSGTRGSMIVPLAGLALLAVVSKNIQVLVTSGIALLFIYCFFAFTNIGQDNQQIRRMRTAFRPTEDASYIVRKDNQKILGEYLKNKPFGEGLGLSGPENQDISIRLTTMIPNDSWYVKLWVETGVVGLTLYLGMLFLAIGRGAYIIMFKIHNRELKGILSALLCGIFGMLASAYGNPFWGQYPTAIIAFSALAIVLKGEYFDNSLEKQLVYIDKK